MKERKRKWTIRLHAWIGQGKHGITVYAKRRYSKGGFEPLDNCPDELKQFLGAVKQKTRWTMPHYKSIDQLWNIDGHFIKGCRRGTTAIIHVEINERREQPQRPLKRFIRELANTYAADNPWRIYRGAYKYTDCGPSIGFCIRGLPEDHETRKGASWREGDGDIWLYCDDLGKLGTFDEMKANGYEIMGVSVSSIVEGSDVDIDGDQLCDTGTMPTMDDWWKLLSAVDDEAKFYWDRDNSQWYSLMGPENKVEHTFHNTWGEINWDGDIPKQLRAAAEEFINSDAADNMKYGEYVDLPGADGWSICEYLNDATY